MSEREPSQEEASQSDVKPKIQVRVLYENREVKFALKRTQYLRKVLAAAAKAWKMDETTIRFTYQGKRLRPEDDDTPESLDMEDDDEIQAHVQQVGGARLP